MCEIYHGNWVPEISSDGLVVLVTLSSDFHVVALLVNGVWVLYLPIYIIYVTYLAISIKHQLRYLLRLCLWRLYSGLAGICRNQ